MIKNKCNLLSGMTHIYENIYIGDEDDAKNFDLLKEKKITHILIAGKYLEKHYPDSFEYHQINISDRLDQYLDFYFDECNEFIKKSTNVLVHCVIGKSRSPAIVMGYLIGIIGMTFQEAFDLVKEKRSIASPNENFIEQLKNYEKKIKEKFFN